MRGFEVSSILSCMSISSDRDGRGIESRARKFSVPICIEGNNIQASPVPM
jgi:hypothetical protein